MIPNFNKICYTCFTRSPTDLKEINQGKSRMTRHTRVKKKSLYSLIIPYLLIGIISSAYLGCRYHQSIQEIRQKHQEENMAVLNKISRELEYLISDMENLTVEIELNKKLMKPVSVRAQNRSGQENYSVAMALRELKDIKKFNHLIEEVMMYYRQGDFFLTPLSIRTERGIYEEYGTNQTVGFDEWKGKLTKRYFQGRLITAGNSIFYVVTVPFNEEHENCNIIVKVDSQSFYELMNKFNLVNESRIFLYNGEQELIASNAPANPREPFDREGIGEGSREEAGESTAVYEESGMEDTGWTETLSMESGAAGLRLVLLSDQREMLRQMKYVRAMYVSGGALFGLLLFIGLYAISVNYRNILLIIERLKKNNGKEGAASLSEFDYINHALSDLEEKMHVQEDAVLDNCIRKALYGLLEEDDGVYQNLLQSQQKLCGVQSMIAVFELCSGEFRDAKESKLNLFIIGNILREIFEDKLQCWIVPVYRWEIVTLNWRAGYEPDKEYVLEGLKKAQNFLIEKLDLPYTVGVSEPVENIRQFAEGYRQAITALEEKEILGDKMVISYGELKPGRTSFEYTAAMEAQLQNVIRLGDQEKAEAFIESIFEEAFRKNPLSSEAGKLLLINLIKSVGEVAKQRQVPLELHPTDVLKKGCTARQIKERLMETVDFLCRQNAAQVDSAKNRQSQIKQYIAAHYQNADLSVAMIAEEFHLNSSYLSRFFKEEAGENLLNYINRYRVERAKELLACTDETIGAISGQTGFLNGAALTRAFKKFEGITPGQYKAVCQCGEAGDKEDEK